MIKVFETQKDYWKKFNAVDDKNNFVGYSLNDDCCAYGGWFISPEVMSDEPDKPEAMQYHDLKDYDFDLGYFKEVKRGDDYCNNFNAVVFRMVAKDKPDLYLHLYNVHNGYYAKGFEKSWGEIKEGSV